MEQQELRWTAKFKYLGSHYTCPLLTAAYYQSRVMGVAERVVHL
jgi:hypothetical protein